MAVLTRRAGEGIVRGRNWFGGDLIASPYYDYWPVSRSPSHWLIETRILGFRVCWRRAGHRQISAAAKWRLWIIRSPARFAWETAR